MDAHSPQGSRRWTVVALSTVGGFLAFSLFMAFIGLPLAQAPNANLDPWTAICRAVGILPGTPAQRQPTSNAKAVPVSQVRWTPRTLGILAGADVRPGAQLAAAVCANCHGENGVSISPDYPQLARQSAQAIYKQLSDFRSGARYSPIMTPVAKQLTTDQLAEVAAYFANNKAFLGLGARHSDADPAADRLARHGDPSRGLPPCESCHGAHAGGPIEAPVLVGQNSEYLERQLKAYAAGGRRNDVYRRMRDVAGKLTPAEMQMLAKYYEGVV